MTDTVRADFEKEFRAFNDRTEDAILSALHKDEYGEYTDSKTWSAFYYWKKAHVRYAPRENKNIIATVRANGDMSVGIWPFYHEIDTGYEELEPEERELFKKTLTELYSEMCQEFAWVEFSDEAESLIATKEPQL